MPSWKGFLAMAGLFIAGLCLASLVAVLLTAGLGNDFFTKYGTLIIYPIQFLPMMIWCSAKSAAACSFAEESEYPLDRKSECGPASAALIALAAAMATISLAFATDPINVLLPPMPQKLIQAMEMLTMGPLWVAVISTVIFAPFFEEWLCRGMILRPLLKKVKPVWAIVISSLVFALIHGNIWQGIPAFVIGCLFGLTYFKTGSLRLTMLMHAANNLFSVIISRVSHAGSTENFYDLFPDKTLYAVVCILCLIVTAAFVILLYRRESRG